MTKINKEREREQLQDGSEGTGREGKRGEGRKWKGREDKWLELKQEKGLERRGR